MARLEYGKALSETELDGSVPVFGTNGPTGARCKLPLCPRAGVIIGRKGAYRGIHWSPRPFWVIDTAFFLSPDESMVDPKWAYYQLLTQDINRMDSGSAIPSTSRDDFYALPLWLPPLGEQRRIASTLDSLDKKIEHDQSVSAKLTNAAALIVDRMLLASRSKDSVYTFASVIYGAAFKSALFGDVGTPVLRIRDLATHLPMKKTTEERAKAHIVRCRDIVVGMDGEFRAHIWHGPDSLLNQRVRAFEPVPGVSRAFVWRAIQPLLALVEATEAGTTVIHLGKADIDEFELPSPMPEHMRELAESADPCLSLSAHLGRQG